MDKTDINSCANCGAAAIKPCSGCKVVRYCSAVCQKQDWPIHKDTCGKSGITPRADRVQQQPNDMREATSNRGIAKGKEEDNMLITQDALVDVGKPRLATNPLMHNDAHFAGAERTDTVAEVGSDTKDNSGRGHGILAKLKENSVADQSLKVAGGLSKSAAVESANSEQGACPDDEDSDFDYDDDDDDDDDDGYEDGYYGDESFDRSAEVRSCGRLHR